MINHAVSVIRSSIAAGRASSLATEGSPAVRTTANVRLGGGAASGRLSLIKKQPESANRLITYDARPASLAAHTPVVVENLDPRVSRPADRRAQPSTCKSDGREFP